MQIQNGFKEAFFCWRSYLNSDDIFSWSEIGSGFGESGGTPPPRIPRSTPLGSDISPPFAVLFLNSIGDNALKLTVFIRISAEPRISAHLE